MKRLIPWALAALSVNALPAQDLLTPVGSLAISFDYARFNYTDSSEYVEMYFACFSPLITFVKGGNGYQGYVELRTEVKNKLTGEYIVRNRSLLTVSAKDTSDPAYHNTLVTQMGYVFPRGDFIMYITGIDSLDRERRDSLTLEVTIPSVKTSLATSDLELCSRIERSTNTGSIFYKNSHEVIPNPTLLFGGANYPVIYHYLEFYKLDPDETYIVKTIIADASGKPLRENTRKRKYSVANAVEVGTTNAISLASGKYRFQILLLSESSEPVAKTEKDIYIYNPGIQAADVSGAKMKETELSGLTVEELDEEFAYLRYHSTEPEIRLYSQTTSADGKRQFLAYFWDLVEKGKMGRDPIKRQEYLARVKKATERFRAFNREGWQTDRGRVFILFGEPDDLERKPSSELSKPYEIWHYYQIENGVDFVFVDRTGFGEYILIHSTKRGELRDDNWRRLLQ